MHSVLGRTRTPGLSGAGQGVPSFVASSLRSAGEQAHALAVCQVVAALSSMATKRWPWLQRIVSLSDDYTFEKSLQRANAILQAAAPLQAAEKQVLAVEQDRLAAPTLLQEEVAWRRGHKCTR